MLQQTPAASRRVSGSTTTGRSSLGATYSSIESTGSATTPSKAATPGPRQSVRYERSSPLRSGRDEIAKVNCCPQGFITFPEPNRLKIRLGDLASTQLDELGEPTLARCPYSEQPCPHPNIRERIPSGWLLPSRG